MPTWNSITTPETDRRPSRVLNIEDYFSFFASIYLLALWDKDVWVFPNCRVSRSTQIEAVRCAGAYTSTEVKVGPGGYLPQALQRVGEKERADVMRWLRDELKSDVYGAELAARLNEMEQFRHHFHDHGDYVEALQKAGIRVT
jgi:hypothetical protein